MFQLLLYVDGNVTIYAARAFWLVDVYVLRLRTFRHIVNCRRERDGGREKGRARESREREREGDSGREKGKRERGALRERGYSERDEHGDRGGE